MTDTDLCYLSLIEVGRKIRAREVSSAEVTAALLERIAQLGGRLRSYATVTSEIALRAAEEADREIASGLHRGPLHGVPIASRIQARHDGRSAFGTGGGVYLWKEQAHAEKWHGEAFRKRVKELYRSEPSSQFFETPIVVDNVAGEIVRG